MERATGLEPVTASLEGWNSTTELRPPRFSHNQVALKVLLTLLTTILRLHRPCPEDASSGNPVMLDHAPRWWAGKDSNLGSRWQQIYSLPPLSTRVPAPKTTSCTGGGVPLAQSRYEESQSLQRNMKDSSLPQPHSRQLQQQSTFCNYTKKADSQAQSSRMDNQCSTRSSLTRTPHNPSPPAGSRKSGHGDDRKS